MNSVLGMASLLNTTSLTEEQREYCRAIEKSGELLLTVINDILDLSKIKAGKMYLERDPVDLVELISDVINMFKDELEVKNLSLYSLVLSDVPVVLGDQIRIRQILINILNNAIKFTSEGHVTCTLSCENRQEESVTIVFKIEDTGVGMTPEEMEIIFEPFSQVGYAERKIQGTGLGLQISRNLSRMMDGSIHVTSKKDIGSTFSVKLNLPTVSGSESKAFDLLQVMTNRKIWLVTPETLESSFLRQQLYNWRLSVIVLTSVAAMRKEKQRGSDALPDFIIFLPGDQTEETIDSLVSEISNYLKDIPILVVVPHRLKDSRFLHDPDTGPLGVIVERPVSPARLLQTLASGLLNPGQIRVHGQGKKVMTRIRSTENPVGVGREKTILLVDDNEENRRLGIRLIKKCGHIPLTATDGLNAIELYEAQKVHLIFMDCQMPVMNGFEATDRIRQLEQRNGKERTPIIALTAGVLSKDSNQCLRSGMDDFLAKPVNIVQFREMLDAWLPENDEGTEAEKKEEETVLHHSSRLSLTGGGSLTLTPVPSGHLKNSILEVFLGELAKTRQFVSEQNYWNVEKSAYCLSLLAENLSSPVLLQPLKVLENCRASDDVRQRCQQALEAVEAEFSRVADGENESPGRLGRIS